MEVFVTTLDGKREPMNIDPSSTFGALKGLVREKTGETQFRLGFRGKKRGDTVTLEEAGVSPEACDIWMSSVFRQTNRTQALGRVARGVQNGSIKHAIVAVGGELAREINTRADGIEDKLEEHKELAASTGKDVSDVLHIIRGGATDRIPGQDRHARVKQIRIQKVLLENERKDLSLQAREELTAKKIAASEAMHDAAVVAEGAVQTAFRDVGSLQELDDEKKKMLKAVAARKKQLRSEEAGLPAEKKPRKGSKAWKAEAAEALAAEAAGSIASTVDPEVAALEDETDAKLAAIERGEFEP